MKQRLMILFAFYLVMSGLHIGRVLAADIDQWAVSAEASTQYGSGSGGWSAAQATGAANIATCGDNINAWSPSTTSVAPESLLLTYQTPVYATGVSVHETYQAPFVTSIAYIEPLGTAHVIWQGTDATACNGWLTVTHAQTAYAVKQVRVNTAKAGYEEIDAVKLTGTPPVDTTAPTVSITVPSSGSTVSGVVTASADAGDNIGVAGVQFKIDGANSGAEDTSSPYSILLDTIGLSNGAHTLTATARDAAGNNATSAGISITVNNSAGGIPITYGQTLTGYIGAANEKDDFSFNGTSGDVITVRFTKTSGTITYINVDLINPSGATVTSSSNGVLNAVLAATGAFKLRVRDYYNTATGAYAIGIQRTKNPAGATAINFGQTAAGNIDMPAKMVTYTFSAAANDTITVRWARISGVVSYVNMELYDPAGTRILASSSGSTDQKVPAAGSYTILFTDYYLANTGLFSLAVQRVNNPGSAVAITFGQTAAGSIDNPVEMDTYTIDAAANDTFTVRTTATNSTSGSFGTNVDMYHPSGAKIITSTGNNFDQKINATGKYTIIVTDYYRDGTGTYAMTMQRTNNPAGVQALSFNTTKEGVIGNRTALVPYSLTVAANSTLQFCSYSKSIVSGMFDSYMELYASNGTKAASGSSFQYKPVSAGTMYLFLSDYYSDGTGVYRFMAKDANVSCSQIDLAPPVVSISNPIPGEMVSNGAVYSINWTATDNVGVAWQEIRLSTDSGATFPTVIATNINGTYASYGWSIPGNLTSVSARLKVIARDAAGNENNATMSGDFLIANTTISGSSATYTYDSLNRLTASNTTQRTNYTYDQAGNRLSLNAQ